MKLSGSAIILAGGQSRRMGQDKAELPWKNTTLLEHAAHQMSALFDDVLIVSGVKPRVVAGARCLSDRVCGEGPMAGLLAGLEQMKHPWAFVMACDMPFIEPPLVRYLWSLTGHDHQAIIPVAHKHRQPLFACYSRSARMNGFRLWTQGERSLQKWIDTLAIRWVTEEELRPLDPQLGSFTNLNTPEEYAARSEPSSGSPLDFFA